MKSEKIPLLQVIFLFLLSSGVGLILFWNFLYPCCVRERERSGGGGGGNELLKESNKSKSKRIYFPEPEGRLVLKRNKYNFDRKCDKFSNKLYEEDTFNLTALVSYPGSGNTWLRHLIELATGLYTGSIYFDIELYGRGFTGEKEDWYSGSTIVQKTHMEYRKKNLSSAFSKAILLIRDPYKSIVSFVQFLEAGHTGQGSRLTFKKKEWPKYVLSQAYKWLTLSKSWLESPSEILVVHYENLRRNTSGELYKICSFLNVPCKFLSTLCFKNHLEGEFRRKNNASPTPQFPSWTRKKIDDGIDYLNKLLFSRNLDAIPLNLYGMYKKD